MKPPIPHAKVVEIVDLIRQKEMLAKDQQATQAEMIRGCVQELRADPLTYRLRGHETSIERSRIVKENRQNKAKALIYLEWLATQLEDASGRLTPSDRQKETDQCSQASPPITAASA